MNTVAVNCMKLTGNYSGLAYDAKKSDMTRTINLSLNIIEIFRFGLIRSTV